MLMFAKRLAIALACAGCAATSPASDVPPATRDPRDPWPLLASGELEEAEAIFADWAKSPEQRPFGLMGLLRVATARGDVALAEKLLPQAAAPYPLLVLAADAAMLGHQPSIVGRELMEHACPPPEDMRESLAARTVCAHVAAFRGRDALSVCRDGCDRAHSLPLGLLAHAPVVMARIGKAEPAPFIVDTGAATTTVTPDFAARAVLEMVPDGSHAIGTAGGIVAAELAVGDVALGGVTIADVRIAVIDIALEGAVGILSPHDVLRAQRTTLDLQNMRMTIAPSGGSAPGRGLPYIQQARRPHLMVAVAGRPARPMLLDTGIARSRISAALEALGPAIERGATLHSATPGGDIAATLSRDPLDFEVGGARWRLPVTIGPVGSGGGGKDVTSFGMIGMDFAIGRRVATDVPERKLYIADEVAPGLPDTALKLRVTHAGKDPVMVSERVVARGDGVAVLEVDIGGEHARRRARRAR